jgi:hypothetical protein
LFPATSWVPLFPKQKEAISAAFATATTAEYKHEN